MSLPYLRTPLRIFHPPSTQVVTCSKKYVTMNKARFGTEHFVCRGLFFLLKNSVYLLLLNLALTNFDWSVFSHILTELT